MDLSSLPTREAPRVLLAEVATKMVGTTTPALTPNVNDACRVTDPDTGDLIAAYYPLDDEHRAELRRAVLAVDMSETYRSNSGRRNASRVFGMSPRKAFQRRESCRPTALAADQPDQHAVLVSLASVLARDLRVFAPEIAERDERILEPVLDEWRMSESSLWTSGVVNKSSTLPYHRDGFNFPVWSAMPVLRRGMDGGHLNIPEYDLTLACRDGWVAYFPGWELLHGVTPMRTTKPDGYRFSVVYYALKGMKDCHTYAMETSEGAKRRTAREAGIASSAAGLTRSKLKPRLTPSKLLPDYVRFHDLAVTTGDVDPVYPVLRAVGDKLSLDPEQRLWLTLLHVAYYQLGSALRCFASCPDPTVPGLDLLRLPTGTERRAHRVPGRLEQHLTALAGIAAETGLVGWISDGLPADPKDAWREVNRRVTSVYGNGRWASFKTAEMLWKVNDLPLAATDMGHANSTGPRQGLALLYPGLPDGDGQEVIAELDEISDRLVAYLRRSGVPAQVEEAETTLCDFHSLVDGRYYVGHDIDQMQEQIAAVPSDLDDVAMAARRASFDESLLGEVNGWPGIRRPLRSLYRDEGRLDWWTE